ncbi:MAG TPA: hypothetical protein DCL48_06720, partial [Alphaproteobacteria bacterium]|nr:hypothetical protein [Alphaproteobacteria bacterium]
MFAGATGALAQPGPGFHGGYQAHGPHGENAQELQACREDVARYCRGIMPGAGRIRACMQSNRDRLSAGCKA